MMICGLLDKIGQPNLEKYENLIFFLIRGDPDPEMMDKRTRKKEKEKNK
jgi:hypothetical protein